MISAEHRLFLQDYLSGLDVVALAQKHGLAVQAVSARIRWAKERGEIKQVESELLSTSSSTLQADLIPSADTPLEPAPSSTPARGGGSSHHKTADEITRVLGSVEGKLIARQEQASARRRIKAHEAQLGRKDALFRIGMEQHWRREWYRRLGITTTDLRRMRGILPAAKENDGG